MTDFTLDFENESVLRPLSLLGDYSHNETYREAEYERQRERAPRAVAERKNPPGA